jgi:hypothetical protein
MATISLCISTNGPADRIYGLLSAVRPAVDEVVLAVDRGGDQRTLEVCAPLVDRLISIEFEPPPCRTIGWLLRQCRCDWILRLDGDELPAPALLDDLPALVARRDLTGYAISRRWLWPDRGQYITSAPWLGDFQLRLARNVPGLWVTRGDIHDPLEIAGEHRYLLSPIYHADLLLAPPDERRKKAERYETLSEGRLAEGIPINAVYIPEDWEDVELADVPVGDRVLIDAVLDARAPQPAVGVRGLQLEHATVPDINRFNANRAVADTALASRLEFTQPVTRVLAGARRSQAVTVENLGEERWPSALQPAPPIRLGFRWIHRTSGEAAGEHRTPFPSVVEPGERIVVLLDAESPARPGEYTLEVGVVHEDVAWAPDRARLDVTVEPPPQPRPAAPRTMLGFRRRARMAGVPVLAALRDYRRWRAALRDGANPLDERRAWLTFAAERALDAAVGKGTRAFEWGTGGSTPALVDRGASLVSVDSDEAWGTIVGDRLPDGADWTLHAIAPEVDPSALNRSAADPAAYTSASPGYASMTFRAYASAIDRYPDGHFDVVLIGGRSRPSCLVHALPKLAPGGLLVLDHAERPWYSRALQAATAEGLERIDHTGPGPYRDTFWVTSMLRRPA